VQRNANSTAVQVQTSKEHTKQQQQQRLQLESIINDPLYLQTFNVQGKNTYHIALKFPMGCNAT
jgi:hypothetical protein